MDLEVQGDQSIKSKTRCQRSTSKLLRLVESHDVAGILALLSRSDVITGNPDFTMAPYRQYSMREYFTENKSPVERACELGHLDILNLFLINGCSPNLPTSHGRLIHTVLNKLKSDRHLIDSGRALVTLRLMLANHCDINVKDYNHKSTLMLACELAEPRILKLMMKKCSDWQLRYASKTCRLTPLHMACMHSSVDCVRILLKRLTCEDVNCSDGRYTPLMCVLKVLSHHQVFLEDAKGGEATLHKTQYSLIAIVELLLNAGADPNAKLCLSAQPSECIKTPICDALDMANTYSERLGQGCDRKLTSPYANLVRLLAYWGAHPFNVLDYSSIKSQLPYTASLIDELEEFSPPPRPSTLLELSRKSLRLRVARCKKLHQLHLLPLPRKLLDYSMFIDF